MRSRSNGDNNGDSGDRRRRLIRREVCVVGLAYGELGGELAGEESGELVRVVAAPGVVVGRQVVVEVVVAPHPDEHDGPRQPVRRRRRAGRADDMRHRRLEVPDLLVERDPSGLPSYAAIYLQINKAP